VNYKRELHVLSVYSVHLRRLDLFPQLVEGAEREVYWETPHSLALLLSCHLLKSRHNLAEFGVDIGVFVGFAQFALARQLHVVFEVDQNQFQRRLRR